MMIRAEALTFEYPGLRALDNVSFAIAAGSITALVGPNGAGKTTLLRCIAGLERPLAGEIAVDGIDVLEHPREAHRRIGYLSDLFGLYDALTVRQCLSFVAAAQGVEEARIPDCVEETASDLGLHDRLQQRTGELSRGLRQRVAIAQAIIHAPPVLMLDEPASGLDPESRHALSQLLVRLRERGMTLLVSSHILAELAEYSTHMLILREGRIVEQSVIGQTHPAGARLRLQVANDVADLAQKLTAFPEVELVECESHSALIRYRGDHAARHRLLSALIADGLAVCAFGEERVDLQQSYLASVRKPKNGNNA